MEKLKEEEFLSIHEHANTVQTQINHNLSNILTVIKIIIIFIMQIIL